MKGRKQARRWLGRVRALFRAFRIGVLFFALALLALYIHLNQVGIPGFLKTRLLAELRRNGVELEYQRLHLHWYRGIVARHVNLGRSSEPLGPQCFVDEVRVRLDWQALKQLRLAVDALVLVEGKLTIPIGADEPPFEVNDVAAELRFGGQGEWIVDRFNANCVGAQIHASGSIGHAAGFRDWSWPGGSDPASAAKKSGGAVGAWPAYLRRFSQLCARASFAKPPRLDVVLRGDATAPAGVGARVKFKAAEMVSSYARFGALSIDLHINQDLGAQPIIESSLEAVVQDVDSRWGRLQEGVIKLQHHWGTGPRPAPDVDWDIRLQHVTFPEGEIPEATLTGTTRHEADSAEHLYLRGSLLAPTWTSSWGGGRQIALRFEGPVPLEGFLPRVLQWEASSEGLTVGQCAVASLQAGGRVEASVTAPQVDLLKASWPTLTAHYLAHATIQAERVSTPDHAIEQLTACVGWSSPVVALESARGAHLGGHSSAHGNWDTQSRRLQAHLEGQWEWQKLAESLGKRAPSWMSRIAWQQPIDWEATIVGPFSPAPDAAMTAEEVNASGQVRARSGEIAGVPLETLAAGWSWDGAHWGVTNLQAAFSTGTIDASGWFEPKSQRVCGEVAARVLPTSLAPWIGPGTTKALQLFHFTKPPGLRAHGEFVMTNVVKTLQVSARVELEDFRFREEPFSLLQTEASFLDPWVTATHTLIRQASGEVTAPALGFHVKDLTLHLTNVLSTMDPMAIVRAIGKKTAKALEPYHFGEPPTARANGWINVDDSDFSDLWFDLEGPTFSWWRFRLPEVRARVGYVNNTVIVTNLQSGFYGGALRGALVADLNAPRGADVRFDVDASRVDLHLLMADLQSPTNTFEGTADCHLTVDSMNSADWSSWQGGGQVSMKDGLLWESPLFGLFSPLLNSIVPGLGKSRADSGTATYRITNSIIATDDLEIRASPVRLHYEGTVDFEGRLKAKVMAEVFREGNSVGRLFNLALWPISKLFEYRVTGTLSKPQSQPLYLPRLLFLPLQPLRFLRSVVTPTPPAAAPSTTDKP